MPPNQPNQLPKASNISKTEWWILIGLIVCIDLLQLVLNILVVGLIFDRLDFLVAFGLYALLRLGGYKFDSNDLIVLGVSMLGEEIPLLDIAPFWTIDVWRFYKKDTQRREQAI